MDDNTLPPRSDPRLEHFRDLLLAATLNVTAVRDREGVERRHIGESLAVVRDLDAGGLLPTGARVIDVGSGGGLPGVPLAIARPDARLTLLEGTQKKAAFLVEVVEHLGLEHVRVLAARAELAAHDPAEREAYDLALARAVAPLATLAELTLPFVRVGGALAAIKGSRAHQEIAEAAVAIARCGGGAATIRRLEGQAPHLCVVIVPKVTPTPPDLPRRPGVPGKRPLR